MILLALVGNDVMGDDGIAYQVFDRIKDRLPEHIRPVRLHGDVLRLLHFYRGEERLVFVDATTVVPCGEVLIVNLEDAADLRAPMMHAHMLGLLDSLRLLDMIIPDMNRAEKILFLVGVPPDGVRVGSNLSSCLSSVLPGISRRLLDLLLG